MQLGGPAAVAASLKVHKAGDVDLRFDGGLPSMVVNGQHQPTVTTAAGENRPAGKSGTNRLQSCDTNVRVETNAQVLATGSAARTGRNELTADSGTVTVLGTVTPAPVTGAACEDSTSLF